MSTNTDHRKFTRVDFDTDLELIQGDKHLACELVDVSLKGILVTEPKNGIFSESIPTEAVIQLSPDISIHMQVSLVHQQDQLLGFICNSIDLDSAKHLRRLIELNLGDDEACERELSEFANYDS